MPLCGGFQAGSGILVNRDVGSKGGGHDGSEWLIRALQGNGNFDARQVRTIRGLLGAVCGTSGDVSHDRSKAPRRLGVFASCAAALVRLSDASVLKANRRFRRIETWGGGTFIAEGGDISFIYFG